MRASSIFVLALTAAVAAAHELLPVSRRAVLLRARDQTLAAVVPRAEVVVNYGEGIFPPPSPSYR